MLKSVFGLARKPLVALQDGILAPARPQDILRFDAALGRETRRRGTKGPLRQRPVSRVPVAGKPETLGIVFRKKTKTVKEVKGLVSRSRGARLRLPDIVLGEPDRWQITPKSFDDVPLS